MTLIGRMDAPVDDDDRLRSSMGPIPNPDNLLAREEPMVNGSSLLWYVLTFAQLPLRLV